MVIPAGLFALLLRIIPESPRWLILNNRDEEAALIFARTGEPDARAVINEEHALLSGEIKKADHAPDENLFSAKFRKPILYAVLLAMFNQLSGINAILYYAPRIFEMAGFSRQASFLQPVYIGCANLLFTFLGMSIIDKVGRKTLLITGAIGMAVFLGLTAFAFNTASGGTNQFGNRLPGRLYRFFCDVAGRGDLGIYFRNISELRSLAGKLTGQFHTLDHGRDYCLDFPDYCKWKYQWRLLFIYLFQLYGAGVPDLYLARNARNKGAHAGADSERPWDCMKV